MIKSVTLITLSPFFTDHLLESQAPATDPKTIQKPTIQIIFPSRAKIKTAAIEYINTEKAFTEFVLNKFCKSFLSIYIFNSCCFNF